MGVKKYLAIDLGAESGRGILGEFNGEKIKIKEIHRFPTYNTNVFSHIFWDVLKIFDEIKIILKKTKEEGEISGVGVTTWGVDCAYIGGGNLLLSNPFHYRDSRTDGIMEEVFSIIPKEEIFEETGIQFMPINTLYQLYSTKKEFPYIINSTEKLLFMPDLFNFFLTGKKFSEYTIATTSQMYNSLLEGQDKAPRGNWAYDIIEKLNIPVSILPEVISPGTFLGKMEKGISEEIGLEDINIYAVCSHDTSSAVVSIPAKEEKYAYISSGTWSLLGVELFQPIINDKSFNYNFTNEGGFGGSITFLKNIMGLWILQECRRYWEKEGNYYDYPTLTEIAINSQPFYSFIDVNDGVFLFPGNMPEKIKEYCKKTGQKIPEEIGQIVRVILESLALEYRYNIENLEQIIEEKIDVVHIVGGGSQNKLLSQFSASSMKKIVITGPSEATAIGNLLVQAIGDNEISDVSQLREIVRNSFPLIVFQPRDTSNWEESYEKYKKLKEFHDGL
ncbi:MAG TPA: rhamnulokinase family protein [Candidatus Ratteibacteria bacterium]|nr:rhamnulokinase family protein [Candidatus Ratteibacteria bacterium]